MAGRPRDPEYTYRDELVLAPTDRHEFAEKRPATGRTDDGRWRLTGDVNGPWLPERLHLDAGETRAFEYALVGRVEGSGFPARRYEFRGYGDSVVTVAAWETDAPGPSETSRFDGASVPPLPGADAMAWYHDADPATEAYLEPSVEHGELPAGVEFTLVNHGRDRLSGNPYYWKLHKLHDGEWFHVAPWGWPAPLSYVPPGGTETWTLAAFPEHAVELDGARGLGYIGGGRYAFEVGMNASDETHAALVEFDAPRVELEPTDDATADRRGDCVIVTSPRRDAENSDPATLTVTRVGSADRRLVAEQVMRRRNRGLRNTLAFFEDGVETVELETDDRTAKRATGRDDETARFEFRGRAYEARRS